MANQKNSQREKTTIVIKGGREFDPITQTMIIEQSEFCAMINGMFTPLFFDFIGSRIQINSAAAAGNVAGIPVIPNPDGTLNDVPLNQYYATLVFRDRGEVPTVGKDQTPEFLKNMRNLNESKSGGETTGLQARFMAFSGTQNRSRNYDLNEDTRDALEEFMIRAPYSPINNEYWKRHIVEYAEQVSSGPYDPKFVAHVKVMGLSLEALVSKIFGDKDEQGNRVEYLVTPTVTPVNAGMSNNLLFQISRLDTKNMRKLIAMQYGQSPLATSFFGVNGRI